MSRHTACHTIVCVGAQRGLSKVAGVELFGILGFLLAAYSIVANDAIQTLGTFLSSNSHRPWMTLWAFACTVILIVLVYGYFANDGDIAYGRLNQIPYQNGIEWWHAVPPFFLLILTRYGVPVSTTFLVLTIFTLTGGAATEEVLGKMMVKSGMGYVVASVSGLVIYMSVARSFERWISETPRASHDLKWTVVQWASTAFLWSQWLIQDLANIFVFLPRETTTLPDGSIHVTFAFELLVFATIALLALHAVIFAKRGGKIQEIVLSKTNTSDVRGAALVNIIYGLILIFFKEISDIPMSTTWVFLGLLAGREVAISYVGGLRSRSESIKDISSDIMRALIGLVVSIVLAIALPAIAAGRLPTFLQ